jgi:hypothetical protein
VYSREGGGALAVDVDQIPVRDRAADEVGMEGSRWLPIGNKVALAAE